MSLADRWAMNGRDARKKSWLVMLGGLFDHRSRRMMRGMGGWKKTVYHMLRRGQILFLLCSGRLRQCAALPVGRFLCMPGMERVSVYWAGFARVYNFFWHEMGIELLLSNLSGESSILCKC
jgi:hypothetical protein